MTRPFEQYSAYTPMHTMTTAGTVTDNRTTKKIEELRRMSLAFPPNIRRKVNIALSEIEQAIADELNATIGEQPAKSGADALSRHARDMARNIQGNLGRCLYRRKDVAEMEEVSETLMELANELNADPGSGTCCMSFVDEYETASGEEEYLCECSKCGYRRWESACDLPLFCSKCGAKVVR